MRSLTKRDLPGVLETVDPDLARRLSPEETATLFREALKLQVDGLTLSYETPPPRRSRGGPIVLGLVTPDERWHINTTSLRKDALWQLLVGLASLATGQAFLSLGAGIVQIRGIAEKITQLDPDEGDLAGTLVRLMKEHGGSAPRALLESAYRHDPQRDGEMPNGSAPIDAVAVINRLIDKKVIVVAADGNLTIPF